MVETVLGRERSSRYYLWASVLESVSVWNLKDTEMVMEKDDDGRDRCFDDDSSR
jgi:hypothetical protein